MFITATSAGSGSRSSCCRRHTTTWLPSWGDRRSFSAASAAVVVQEGDYFGRTVNVAARIADYARPREVLVSEAARQGVDVGEVEFEFVGDVALKGVSKTVRLHKATRSAGRVATFVRS